MMDMIDNLMMLAGEASLLQSAMRLGLLTDSTISVPLMGLRADEKHTAVVKFTGTPRRLVLDESTYRLFPFKVVFFRRACGAIIQALAGVASHR